MIESFITEDNNNLQKDGERLARWLAHCSSIVQRAATNGDTDKVIEIIELVGSELPSQHKHFARNTGDPGASNAYHGQQARGSRQFFGFCMRRQRDRQVLGDPQSGQGLSAGKVATLSGEE